jgi:hypothetical protein
MYGGPLTNGFRSNRASALASGTISVCGVGLASDHPQKEHDQGKSPLLNFLPAASRMNTRSPSSRARRASCTSKRRQMSEMMCSMCGFGAVRARVAVGAGGGRQRGGASAAFEFEEVEEGSTAVADDADDAKESEAPLPLLPLQLLPLPFASISGHRASPQRRRSSATRSALQGGRCEFFFLREKKEVEKEHEAEDAFDQAGSPPSDFRSISFSLSSFLSP